MKEWQFDVLFIVAVGGAVFLLIGPSLGLSTGDNPLALTGVGAILTYVLSQKNRIVEKTKDHPKKEVDKDGST